MAFPSNTRCHSAAVRFNIPFPEDRRVTTPFTLSKVEIDSCQDTDGILSRALTLQLFAFGPEKKKDSVCGGFGTE